MLSIIQSRMEDLNRQQQSHRIYYCTYQYYCSYYQCSLTVVDDEVLTIYAKLSEVYRAC
jgi:hypothetical protein